MSLSQTTFDDDDTPMPQAQDIAAKSFGGDSAPGTSLPCDPTSAPMDLEPPNREAKAKRKRNEEELEETPKKRIRHQQSYSIIPITDNKTLSLCGMYIKTDKLSELEKLVANDGNPVFAKKSNLNYRFSVSFPDPTRDDVPNAVIIDISGIKKGKIEIKIYDSVERLPLGEKLFDLKFDMNNQTMTGTSHGVNLAVRKKWGIDVKTDPEIIKLLWEDKLKKILNLLKSAMNLPIKSEAMQYSEIKFDNSYYLDQEPTESKAESKKVKKEPPPKRRKFKRKTLLGSSKNPISEEEFKKRVMPFKDLLPKDTFRQVMSGFENCKHKGGQYRITTTRTVGDEKISFQHRFTLRDKLRSMEWPGDVRCTAWELKEKDGRPINKIFDSPFPFPEDTQFIEWEVYEKNEFGDYELIAKNWSTTSGKPIVGGLHTLNQPNGNISARDFANSFYKFMLFAFTKQKNTIITDASYKPFITDYEKIKESKDLWEKFLELAAEHLGETIGGSVLRLINLLKKPVPSSSESKAEKQDQSVLGQTLYEKSFTQLGSTSLIIGKFETGHNGSYYQDKEERYQAAHELSNLKLKDYWNLLNEQRFTFIQNKLKKEEVSCKEWDEAQESEAHQLIKRLKKFKNELGCEAFDGVSKSKSDNILILTDLELLVAVREKYGEEKKRHYRIKKEMKEKGLPIPEVSPLQKLCQDYLEYRYNMFMVYFPELLTQLALTAIPGFEAKNENPFDDTLLLSDLITKLEEHSRTHAGPGSVSRELAVMNLILIDGVTLDINPPDAKKAAELPPGSMARLRSYVTALTAGSLFWMINHEDKQKEWSASLVAQTIPRSP